MRTTELHRTAPTLDAFDATVVGWIELDDGTTAVELDRSAFYARSGGQAGDRGVIAIGPDELIVVDTRYSPDHDRVLHHLASGSTVPTGTGVTVEAQIDRDRRRRLTIGHTAQHLAYLAAVVVLGPRPATGGTIDIDAIRVDIAHSAAEGTIDALAISDAYRSLVGQDLEIRRWADPTDPSVWWWAIDGHEPIGCGGTHLASTGAAAGLSPTIKRKGSKNAVIKLAAPA